MVVNKQVNNKSNEKLESCFAGMQKFTTLDDPGNLSATFFTRGCNFKCRYCHNPQFVSNSHSLISSDEIISFLQKRQNILDTIVICGGEPTLHSNLIDWLKVIKSYGFKVKLDTNATNEMMLKNILKSKLVDFFAIDYKAPQSKHKVVTQTDFNHDKILQNIKLIVDSKVPYEIRTTVHSQLLCKEDIEEMISNLKQIGVNNYNLQSFRKAPNILDETLGEDNSRPLIKLFDEKLKNSFSKSQIRNLI